ncbi:MAG TPA: MarR family transcriptional regulator [Treponemataceae bacterium]|jgi:MarR family transcriptional repressor of mepA|nr:MarR family transcriptional regulator [Treponemataceae bacterium]
MDRRHNSLMIGSLVKRLEGILTTKSNNFLKQYNITWSQVQILKYLAVQEELCQEDGKERAVFQKDIEIFFNLTNPTVTGLINRLETKGLLVRETLSRDRRWRRLRITEEGLALEKHIYEEFIRMDGDMMAPFSDSELGDFTLYLERLLHSLSPEILEKSRQNKNLL